MYEREKNLKQEKLNISCETDSGFIKKILTLITQVLFLTSINIYSDLIKYYKKTFETLNEFFKIHKLIATLNYCFFIY